MLYNDVHNEFHLSDEDTGKLLGLKAVLDIVFGLMGSLLLDRFGGRAVCIVACQWRLLVDSCWRCVPHSRHCTLPRSCSVPVEQWVVQGSD